MALSSKEVEQKIIDAMKDETGATPKTWSARLKKCGHEKRNDMIKWLKTEHGLKHNYASVAVGLHLNGGKPVYADGGNLLDNQLAGKEAMRPLYDAVKKAVLKWNPKVEVHPTKTYVSFRGKREFAVAAIKSKEIRVGFDLGDAPCTGKLEKAKSLGAMPRIGHMLVVKEKSDIGAELTKSLKAAWKRIEG